MSYPSITTAISGQRSAGISKVYINTGSEKWQSLGFIRNGELKITPYSSEDTHKRNHAHAFTIEAKVELLQTASAEVELISSIVNGSNNFLFKLNDAGAIPTTAAATEGWVYVTYTQVGVSAKYQSDGNPSSNQFIELVIKGSVIAGSSMTALVKATIDDGDFTLDATSDQTYSLTNNSVFGNYDAVTSAGNETGINSNIKPNGFSTVELANNDTTYSTLGRVRNGKIVCDFVAEEDSLGRPNVYAVDIDVEYEYLVSDATTLLLLDDMNTTNTNVRITLLDGKVFTLESKLGVGISFENVGDFDKFRVLKFSHKGRILSSDFNSIVA